MDKIIDTIVEVQVIEFCTNETLNNMFTYIM